MAKPCSHLYPPAAIVRLTLFLHKICRAQDTLFRMPCLMRHTTDATSVLCPLPSYHSLPSQLCRIQEAHCSAFGRSQVPHFHTVHCRWTDLVSTQFCRAQDTLFGAPCLMRHTIDAQDKKGFSNITAVYATPIAPGRSRAIIRNLFKFKSPIPRFFFSELLQDLFSGMPSTLCLVPCFIACRMHTLLCSVAQWTISNSHKKAVDAFSD